MRKIITKDRKIDFLYNKIYYDDLPDDIEDIKLTGDKYIDLMGLDLNIVKYELYYNGYHCIIQNCDINKLVLNGNRRFIMTNCRINDIYIQSEIEKLTFINANIPNLHGRIDLINEIIIDQ